jgi:hypothetical protein
LNREKAASVGGLRCLLIMSIDQYAEAAPGNYFLNRPYGIGGKGDAIP